MQKEKWKHDQVSVINNIHVSHKLYTLTQTYETHMSHRCHCKVISTSGPIKWFSKFYRDVLSSVVGYQYYNPSCKLCIICLFPVSWVRRYTWGQLLMWIELITSPGGSHKPRMIFTYILLYASCFTIVVFSRKNCKNQSAIVMKNTSRSKMFLFRFTRVI